VAYISAGLFFMLLPGTFLGVWNLIEISRHRNSAAVSAAWIQAHGHAQIFGWIGSFILGIGYYSIPKLRRLKPYSLWAPWTTWGMWVAGVGLRWAAGVYEWHWRALLIASAALELAALAIFMRAVSGHRNQKNPESPLEPWVLVVIAGCVGWAASLLINLVMAVTLALQGAAPVLPHSFDQRFLVLQTWGFLVPLIWGFSSRWLPTMLGLRPLRISYLRAAVAVNTVGVLLALISATRLSTVALSVGVIFAVLAIRIFERSERPAKTQGVHSTFGFFIRSAYAWALVSAALGIWAARAVLAPGIWGASRHALTVGFVATMVFGVGQRILPAFSGMRVLFSPKLMFCALALLGCGCALRVGSEVFAYQNILPLWKLLPISAVTEMTAVTLFAANLLITFMKPRASAA
jgi:hypothetical protein